MWIVYVIAVLIGVWILVAIVRAIFAPRPSQWYGQPPGYGQPMQGPPPVPPQQSYGNYPPSGYPPPGYGGSRGGFLPGLFGGLFGAAAGNWMYDRFARGNNPNPNWGNQPMPPQQPPAYNPNPVDQGTYDASTGGDFGNANKSDTSQDMSAGGDFDGGGRDDSTGGDYSQDDGGGDFGGGDDSGGGGDFGGGDDSGGGGDFGGGDGGGGDF